MHWVASGVLAFGAVVRLTFAAVLLKAEASETRSAGLWVFTVEGLCLLTLALLIITALSVLWALAVMLVVADFLGRLYFRRRTARAGTSG